MSDPTDDPHEPHDAFFGSVFALPSCAGALFRAALPPSASRAIAWQALRPASDRLVGERLGKRQADLVFTADLRPPGAGRSILVLEHKSYRDRTVLRQMRHYTQSLALRHAEQHPGWPEPFIVPLLVHHGPRPLDPDLLGPLQPRALQPFRPGPRVLLLDFRRFDEARVGAMLRPPLAALAMRCMQFTRDRSADHTEACLRRWQDLLRRIPGGPSGSWLNKVSCYVVEASHLPAERLARLLAELIGPDAEENLMTTYSKMRREGHAEGRAEGGAEVLLQLLTVRFGPLDPEVQQKVRSAPIETIHRWAKAILDAHSLEQVFAS